MKYRTRTKNSLINTSLALVSYAILFLGPFFVSPFLENHLGGEFLGIQKTLVDIVALLSIVELGISYGIIYKLYGPIAHKDHKKIAILLNFYKNAFKVVASVVLISGLILTLMIPKIFSQNHTTSSVSNAYLTFAFLLYILDTLLTYLFGHKRAMLIADQRNYVLTVCRTSCQLLMFTGQILVIYFFKSFLLYVVTKVSFTLLESLLINWQYDIRYSDHIDLKIKDKLPKSEKKDVFKNLNALFYHKIGYQSLISGSTLIMTKKLGKVLTGYYYPYTLITNGLISVITQVFNAILSSFGNFLSSNTKEKIYDMYKKIFFLNHLIFSFFTVSFVCLVEPFVYLWMGEAFIFPIETILLITANFYLLGMRQSISMVKSSVGLYWPDRHFAIIEAALNLTLAWFLVTPYGINGILAANLISTILVPFWVQPYVVYENILKKPVSKYYKRFSIYLAVTLIQGSITYYLCSLFPVDNAFFKLIINAGFCVLIPNIINLILFCKSKELVYLINVAKNLLR
ncbi:MAG: hypothetical protein IJ758_04065 [Clostridia bacterium]|nr:hypothetical protein [Clostridia bacterium]